MSDTTREIPRVTGRRASLSSDLLHVPIVGNMTEVQLQLTLQGTKYYKDDDLNKP
jgi:hypothetical protein